MKYMDANYVHCLNCDCHDTCELHDAKKFRELRKEEEKRNSVDISNGD